MTEFAPYTHPSAAFVPYSAAKPLRVRAMVATVALALVMVSTAVTVGLSYFATSITDDAAVRGSSVEDAETVAAGIFALTAFLGIAAMVFAGIAFVCWLHRARTNIDAFGGSWMKWGPGWTIGAWFVPIGNLVIPILVVSEIDRATDGRVPGWGVRRPGRIVVVLWATLWTAFLILDRVTTFAMFDAAHSSGAFAVTLVSAAVEIGAASGAIGVIRRITAGQEAVLSGGGAFPGPAGPEVAFPGPAGPDVARPAFPRPAAPAPGPTHASAPYAAAGDSWEAGLASGPIGWDTPKSDRRD